MKIIRSKYLPPLRNYSAINLFGVFFVHPDVAVTKRLINHESIHSAQMRELLYLPFYILYLLEWFIRLFGRGDAYFNLSFEREAYKNEANYNYLNERKHYAWIKYMRKKKKNKKKSRKRFRRNIKKY
ncbi:MAG: hypothetical protein IK100_01680 [Muribaculaceae bacterium]|nr:hypothetical protein [Muribaculaceae bacterium]MBR5117338.1 hypothetical protein [Muribaculaceae bacterium]